MRIIYLILALSIFSASNAENAVSIYWNGNDGGEYLFFSPLKSNKAAKYKPAKRIVHKESKATSSVSKSKATSSVSKSKATSSASSSGNKLNYDYPTMISIVGGCIVGDSNQEWQCVDSFAISNTEITNAQYRKFRPNHNSGQFRGLSLNGDNQPVVNVTLQDAENYAKWLSSKTGKYYRLPSNLEWQYVANAGGTNSNLNVCDYANIADCDNVDVASTDVASYKKNAWGLYDIFGNVLELVESSNISIAKGGSWLDLAKNISLKKDYRPQSKKASNIGFRLVAD